jgi:hypothetical protein
MSNVAMNEQVWNRYACASTAEFVILEAGWPADDKPAVVVLNRVEGIGRLQAARIRDQHPGCVRVARPEAHMLLGVAH